MLVLTRKPGESIRIDGEITVTVSEVRGGRVKLSIDAPKSVRIVRVTNRRHSNFRSNLTPDAWLSRSSVNLSLIGYSHIRL